MKRLQKQAGFTLIELVVVIVILGILAVTAAPKFVDLTGDANGATLQGVKAAVETATTGVHAKSLIAGNHTTVKGDDPTVTVAGATIEIGSGWHNATLENFNDLLDIQFGAGEQFSNVVEGTSFFIYITGDTAPTVAAPGNCRVQYTESANSNVKPVIDIDVTGCS
ncbi:type II secretion system protein [Thalassomonas actiniarum]|uniref:Type II secretion system protein n=1 Tax=Thalassomonas actiniarum TaxID=485447 RepID=A0AAF0C2Q7_9GAMM|nr:type II secretion system protein [Thalassomonas actiniarum]WDD98183.1 type II secretion system protein [Thalassomonas actiniarum]